MVPAIFMVICQACDGASHCMWGALCVVVCAVDVVVTERIDSCSQRLRDPLVATGLMTPWRLGARSGRHLDRAQRPNFMTLGAAQGKKVSPSPMGTHLLCQAAIT